MLADYYDWFAQDFPGLIELELGGRYDANPQHRWGLAPIHYEDRYYIDMASALNAI